jgi:dTDP-glucose 4,6-dehydratase
VDRSILDPVPFVQNNVNLMLSILEYAREVQPEKFIQISTDEVYGAAPEGVDYKEWASILPSNPYSASKAAQEALSISYWRTYNVPLILTNTMNMFGERQDPEKYIPMLISRISQGKHVEVHGSSEYIGKRHYLHAKDFSDALLFLLKEVDPQLFYFKNSRNVRISLDHLSPANETYPSRFNVVGQVELDNYQMAEKVAQILGKELSCVLIDFHRARPGHDTRYSLCGDKLDQLGWKHPFSFQKSLEKTIEWTLKNPVWMN